MQKLNGDAYLCVDVPDVLVIVNTSVSTHHSQLSTLPDHTCTFGRAAWLLSQLHQDCTLRVSTRLVHRLWNNIKESPLHGVWHNCLSSAFIACAGSQ